MRFKMATELSKWSDDLRNTDQGQKLTDKLLKVLACFERRTVDRNMILVCLQCSVIKHCAHVVRARYKVIRVAILDLEVREKSGN